MVAASPMTVLNAYPEYLVGSYVLFSYNLVVQPKPTLAVQFRDSETDMYRLQTLIWSLDHSFIRLGRQSLRP